MASLEDVLALAHHVGGGVELDIRTVRDEVWLADLLAQYGLLDTSIIASSDPVRVMAAQPTAPATSHLMWH